MSWTLSKAAQAFAQRLRTRHGAQEEPDGGSGITSVLHLQDVQGRRSTSATPNGVSQVCGRLDAGDDRPPHADADHQTADGLGLPPAEGQCSGHRRGDGHQDQGEAEGQEQDHQNPMDSPGNRRTIVKIHSPATLEREPKDMHLQCGARWERLEADPSLSSSATEVPQLPESKSLLTTMGTYPEFLPAPRSKPEQGNIQLKVDVTGQIGPASGTSGSSSAMPKKTPKPETQRARSASKERTPTGLRPIQPPKKTAGTMPTFAVEDDPQELVISDDEEPWRQVEMVEPDATHPAA